MNIQNILDNRTSKVKTNSKVKILKGRYQEYSDSELNEMLKMYDNQTFNYDLKLKVGEKIVGKVAGQTDTEYLFDIGYRDFLRVEKKRNETNALMRYVDEDNSISEASEIEILITELKDSPFTIKGSLVSLHKNYTYEDILDNMDEPIMAYVQDSIPAGFNLILNYNEFKIPAFMPNILAGVNKLAFDKAQSLVGTNIEIMIESFSEEKGTFIASRKKYLRSLIPNLIDNLQIKNEKGEHILYTGLVTGSTKFGIFLEFNELLTGLLHKDNMNDDYKGRYQAVKAGETINFYIQEIIKDKIILTQVFKETLWDKLEVGQVFEGIVEDFKDVGFLIRISPELKGMVHSLFTQKINLVLKTGDKVKVKVTFIDKGKRKIFLEPVI